VQKYSFSIINILALLLAVKKMFGQ
jgi:hypothetical protein